MGRGTLCAGTRCRTNRPVSYHFNQVRPRFNGWLVDGDGVEIVSAYTRDHAREIGAGTFLASGGGAGIVMHRATDMHPVSLQRFLANASLFLARGG